MDDQVTAVHFTYTAEAATWTFAAIAAILFGLKSFASFGLDYRAGLGNDLLISLSWVLAVCRQGFYQKGLTSIRHVSATNLPDTIPSAAFWVFFSDYWFFISSPVPKLAIGLLLIRLFRPKKWLKYSIIGSCLLLAAIGVGGICTSMLYCSPPSYQYDPYRHPGGHCWSETIITVYTFIFAIIGALIDFAFALYPGIVVYKLQMPVWKKLGTAALMSLGIISGAVCIVKLPYLMSLRGDISIFKKLHVGTILGLYCGIENDILICAACLPFLPPIARACRPFVRKYTDHFGPHGSRFFATNESSLTKLDIDE